VALLDDVIVKMLTVVAHVEVREARLTEWSSVIGRRGMRRSWLEKGAGEELC